MSWFLALGLSGQRITKVVEVDVPRRLLFLEEMGDGSLRLTYSKALIEDVSLLETLRIVKEAP